MLTLRNCGARGDTREENLYCYLKCSFQIKTLKYVNRFAQNEELEVQKYLPSFPSTDVWRATEDSNI